MLSNNRTLGDQKFTLMRRRMSLRESRVDLRRPFVSSSKAAANLAGARIACLLELPASSRETIDNPC